ncbi:MAG TPA: hypothetical protein VE258_18795, partial [Ktedonobacterales bacterium]|nr:hypothetical protein [Ktedonobacterales bacterium]
MFDLVPAIGGFADRVQRPVLRFLHVRLGISPAQVTWAAFAASVVAAGAIATRHVGVGLALMALG